MKKRPLWNKLPKKTLDELNIKESDILLEVANIGYKGGYLGLSPKISNRGGTLGNVIVTKSNICFIVKSILTSKIKEKIIIPINKIIKGDIQQTTGHESSLQETAGMTYALGPLGLALAQKKQTFFKLSFKDKSGIKHEPIFAFSNKKRATEFGKFLMNLIK